MFIPLTNVNVYLSAKEKVEGGPKKENLNSPACLSIKRESERRSSQVFHEISDFNNILWPSAPYHSVYRELLIIPKGGETSSCSALHYYKY